MNHEVPQACSRMFSQNNVFILCFLVNNVNSIHHCCFCIMAIFSRAYLPGFCGNWEQILHSPKLSSLIYKPKSL
ncbi:hypothetical protein RJT34_00494 [Clitoria ternatea]|uniref:Uncharacterized protein n=1 Tax=Clitoria ternatea TaxID=43366 RepID=A0AAN9KIA6_CLITE